ncbi:MAG: TetR/AcrR family transcriptional regulator [Candidatus Heimdallarchaeota archaeon]|nr:TetR/AcrR family transcriptional regulator [Candidatus Heimdallarchaeota archaeon]
MSKEKAPKKRVRDKRKKIEMIYAIFFDLIKKEGYAKVTTNQIAEMAGISIGTIYRYFPKGKIDIISKYYDSEQQSIFDIEELLMKDNFELADFTDFARRITTKYVQIHRENLIIHKAYEQAMLEDTEVLEVYKEKVLVFIHSIASTIYRSNSKDIQDSLEEIEKKLLFIYNIYEALTHQHLFVLPLFPTDEEFIDFLTKLFLLFTLDSSNNPEK